MRLGFMLSISTLEYGQASRPVEAVYDRTANQTLFIASSPSIYSLRRRTDWRNADFASLMMCIGSR
jgi:hypothetical protein